MDRRDFIRSLAVLALAPHVGLPAGDDVPGVGGEAFKVVLKKEWCGSLPVSSDWDSVKIWTGREGMRLFEEALERERLRALWL